MSPIGSYSGVLIGRHNGCFSGAKRDLSVKKVADTGWDADFLAFWARQSGIPESWKVAYNNVFLNMKSRNIFTKCEQALLFCGHNQADSRVNLISGSHTASAVNSPTFSAKGGYTGNGSTSYLDSNWNPGASALYKQDDGCCIITVETQGASGAYNCGVYSAGTIAVNIPLNNGFVVSCNAGFKVFSGATDYSGLLGVGRISASEFEFYIESSAHAITQASTGVPNGNVYYLAINAVPYGVPDGHVNSKISSAFNGAYIDPADWKYVVDQFKSDIAAL